ncbi:hypothetical protein [Chitinimonas taiwanensis]|uniref:Uncharacterized protein n=1 Tax=Chitinimonas taiwanensis DSM 18899 TaxID=1121279 RepID=A0A1K2HPY0_9NEIS|nr:hypothetical protein [Chitinimonas taiwanensis]SFZ78815.1 hypothetical protein SAMN02745887_03211 [Chitinimonas taiwanensis DSM 18899]
MTNAIKLAIFAFFAMIGLAQAAAGDPPTVDVGADVTKWVTWAIGLMAAAFAAKLALPLARAAFVKVMGFMGR